MASPEMLRRTILRSLDKNRALLVRSADYAASTCKGRQILRAELAGALAEDVAQHIAIEATLERPERRPVFAWPAGVSVTECEVLRPDGRWERVALRRDGRWERYDAAGVVWGGGWKLETSLVWRHSPEMEPAGGGFGARHKGRPRQTVADADGRCPDCSGGGWLPSTPCPRCEGSGQETRAKALRERMFFPRAFRTPGGDRWLAENGVRLWP